MVGLTSLLERGNQLNLHYYIKKSLKIPKGNYETVKGQTLQWINEKRQKEKH
jgi:hypothetical protein